jgi:hypothetical protein
MELPTRRAAIASTIAYVEIMPVEGGGTILGEPCSGLTSCRSEAFEAEIKA